MRVKKVIAIVLLLLAATLGLFLKDSLIQAKNKSSSLVSPFSQFYKAGINLWLPKLTNINTQDEAVKNISAKSGYFVEVNSGEVLYQKDPNSKLPIASLVKVMTAILSLENKNLNDKFIVSEKAAYQEPDEMQLIAGERLTLEELLYGIFLISANDAAEVLAEGLTGDRETFISLMNKKAKLLGMENTLFTNPTGYDEDEKEHYSTAYDVMLMARYLIKNYPQVLSISSTEHVILPKSTEHQDYDMYSGINLLTTYPGVLGLKTGFTPQAGYSLITIVKKADKVVLGVLLDAPSRRDDAKILVDYCFKKLGL